VENDPESTTRSDPEPPIIGLIESSDVAACHEAGTSNTPKEFAPGTKKPSPSVEQLPPSAAARGADTAAGAGTSGEAGGSGKSTVRVVPF